MKRDPGCAGEEAKWTERKRLKKRGKAGRAKRILKDRTGRRGQSRAGRARWAVNLYPGQPLGAISGSFEVPPWPSRRYKDKLCLRHRHAPPLYTIILQADPRNGHSISTRGRDILRSPLYRPLSLPLSHSLSFSHHTRLVCCSYTPIRGIGPSLFLLSDSLQLASFTVSARG